MTSALCIDFGTSSIRAVFRDEQNNRHVLPIGRVTGSKSIDEASIRSEIHIDAQGKNVRYGENAVIARSKLDPTNYYESSPKLWLLDPDELDNPAFLGLKVTKRELLTGLIAYGIYGALEALTSIKITNPHALGDIRIAHPVWEESIATRANQELLNIGYAASEMAKEGDWGTVSISILRSYFSHPYSESLHPKSDVVEPIAAALELLSRKVNVRKICAVVDVGAGTTDIGLFYSVVTERHNDRLIPISSTRSVYEAGNEIDSVLFTLLVEKSRSRDELSLYDVRSRIRFIKEFLFTNGFVQELGVRINLEDLEKHPDIRIMSQEIRACFIRVIEADSNKFLHFDRHPIIEIVMAGGGGSVQFIRNELVKPVSIGATSIQMTIADSVAVEQLTYGASHERLAVALGGANIFYDSLKHEHEKINGFSSLGKAKQEIKNTKQTVEIRPTNAYLSTGNSSPNPEKLIRISKETKEKALWREKISKLAKVANIGNADVQYELSEELTNRSTQYALEAMSWLVRAARQGHTKSQIKLVRLLLSGVAIEIDYNDSYFWLIVAARSGNKEFLDQSKTVRQYLSADAAEKIQIEALTWVAKTEVAYYTVSHQLIDIVGVQLVTKKETLRKLLDYANKKRLLNHQTQILQPDPKLSLVLGNLPIKVTDLEAGIEKHIFFQKVELEEKANASVVSFQPNPVPVKAHEVSNQLNKLAQPQRSQQYKFNSLKELKNQELLWPNSSPKKTNPAQAPELTSQKLKVIQPPKSQQPAVNAFDEVKIRELIRHSSFLKKPSKVIDNLNELTKWSKKKDDFESIFLANYCQASFNSASISLSGELNSKLEAWLAFCKRRGL